MKKREKKVEVKVVKEVKEVKQVKKPTGYKLKESDDEIKKIAPEKFVIG